MIQEVKMFTVICDNCKKDANESSEYSCWGEANIAEEMAMNSDWTKEEDKHYCRNCVSYDDNDNLILKTIEP